MDGDCWPAAAALAGWWFSIYESYFKVCMSKEHPVYITDAQEGGLWPVFG